jgi:hypothetical protein
MLFSRSMTWNVRPSNSTTTRWMEFVPMSIAASFTTQHAIKIHSPAGFSRRACAGKARYAPTATTMSVKVTSSARSSDFQRAFVALRYFWGARGDALVDALQPVGVQPAAAAVLAGLTQSERSERARVLAAELGRIATALEQRSLSR